MQQSYQASAVYSLRPLPQSTDAIAEAARARLTQQETLAAIAKQLDWNRLGETGEQSQTSIGFLRELMTGREMTLGRSEAAQRERLEQMLLVSAAGYPGAILVSASSTDAQFAADAANAAAMQLASLEGGASSSEVALRSISLEKRSNRPRSHSIMPVLQMRPCALNARSRLNVMPWPLM